MRLTDATIAAMVEPCDNAAGHLRQLQKLYKKAGYEKQFGEERKVLAAVVPKLCEEVGGKGYALGAPFGVGSTATIWRVCETRLGLRGALKIARPKLGKVKDIVTLIRGEAQKIASLHHPNIIRVHFAGDVCLSVGGDNYRFPYFVMDLLKKPKDLDKFILEKRRELGGYGIIQCFRDAADGIAHLHRRKVIHCDIKPANIFVALVRERPELVIADLGYAKNVARSAAPSESTEFRGTEWYAHPKLRNQIVSASDSNAVKSEIQGKQLAEAFDLFALGRSIQEILYRLSEAEKEAGEESASSARGGLTPYQYRYLSFIAKRLLDGQHSDTSPKIPPVEEVGSSTIRGLPLPVMQEIKYTEIGEAVEDLEKLLHLYDLEGRVPELNPTVTKYIQVPLAKAPLTDRVAAIVNHASFRRLAHTSQLGLVSLVYSGACHSRFEHALGTFAMACRVFRALWYDEANPLFQCIMSQHDLECGLVASLLHDIGQYPMAHDLAEVDSEFSHELFTETAIAAIDGTGKSLRTLLEQQWQCEGEDVLRILTANSKSAFKDRVLNAVISGPLDCDKLDYLQRDSIHLGVTYGFSLDVERLLRNLTLAYGPGNTAARGSDDAAVQVDLGVLWKALPAARAVVTAREDMFRQVYWHHTVRAVKAMLAYVVRRILSDLRNQGDKREFRGRFREFALGSSNRPALCVERNGCQGGNRAPLDELITGDTPATSGADDALLRFLASLADEKGRRLIQAIRDRNLYRRLNIISPDFDRDGTEDFKRIYSRFREYRMDGNHKGIEEWRGHLEQKVREVIDAHCEEKREASPQGLPDVDPLLLIDVPVKAKGRLTEEKPFLRYLGERPHASAGSLQSELLLDFENAPLDLGQDQFDASVGKVRIFVAPEWSDLVARVAAAQNFNFAECLLEE